MKNRIIFVGVHNKSDLKPLDSKTKTGKIVDKIINKLPKDYIWVKTNLFNQEYLPLDDYEKYIEEWYWTNLPTNYDIVILLGKDVQKHFNIELKRIIKVNHPASIYGKEKEGVYINLILKEINKLK
jgi:hypothetical protein